jgi:hypothetical protein
MKAAPTSLAYWVVATPTSDEIQARLTALQKLGGGATREDILA